MTTSTYDRRILIEQLRYMETEQVFTCDNEAEFCAHGTHQDFEHRLWQRARCIVSQHGLSPLLGRAARLVRYGKMLALLLAAVFGALATVYAISDRQSINIYWLLLVLLGFNLLSMLLWLTGISLNIPGLSAGMLSRISGWLPRHFASSNRFVALADRAWLTSNFTGLPGRWQLSRFSHQLWLVYLCSGLLFLVLLLMVRQYDFVWGTTLLSDASFVRLTGFLSTPLQMLALSTPSAEQIAASRIDSGVVLTAEYRLLWAQFLLATLILFGIVPRLLLWSWSVLMSVRARRCFALDLYLPYYISLRQQLLPLATHGRIIDADASATVVAATPLITAHPQAPPAGTLWVALETAEHIDWPPPAVTAEDDLGRVFDRASLQNILRRLESEKNPAVAVVVEARRAPDRGIQRSISELLSGSSQCWLVLLLQQRQAVSASRLAAWYRLAEACRVPADHVISMHLE